MGHVWICEAEAKDLLEEWHGDLRCVCSGGDRGMLAFPLGAL